MSPSARMAGSTGATVQSWPDSIFPLIELPRGRKDTASPFCNRSIWTLARPIRDHSRLASHRPEDGGRVRHVWRSALSSGDILHHLIVPDRAVETEECLPGLGFDDGRPDIVACEGADRIHRRPPGQHEEFHAVGPVPPQQGGAEEPCDVLKLGQYRPSEMLTISERVRRPRLSTPRPDDHDCTSRVWYPKITTGRPWAALSLTRSRHRSRPAVRRCGRRSVRCPRGHNRNRRWRGGSRSYGRRGRHS